MSENMNNVKTLPELAAWYVFEILGCSLERDSIKEIFDKASAKYQAQAVPSTLSPAEQFLFSRLGATNYLAYQGLVANTSSALQSPQAASLKNTKEASLKSASSEKTSAILLELSRPYHDLCRNAPTPSDKLDLMCSAVFEVRGLIKEGKKMKTGGKGGKQCKGYRQIYQFGKIVACLSDCFEGNKKVFLETYPTLPLASFQCVKEKNHSLTA